MPYEVKLTTPVLLLTRRGEETTTQDALIVGVLRLDPFTGVNGEPALDLITVNPAELEHAGTSDWTRIVDRRIAVVHHSHPNFADRKRSEAYKFPYEAEAVAYTSFTQDDFSGDGDPYGINAQYTKDAFQPEGDKVISKSAEEVQAA